MIAMKSCGRMVKRMIEKLLQDRKSRNVERQSYCQKQIQAQGEIALFLSPHEVYRSVHNCQEEGQAVRSKTIDVLLYSLVGVIHFRPTIFVVPCQSRGGLGLSFQPVIDLIVDRGKNGGERENSERKIRSQRVFCIPWDTPSRTLFAKYNFNTRSVNHFLQAISLRTLCSR